MHGIADMLTPHRVGRCPEFFQLRGIVLTQPVFETRVSDFLSDGS